MNVLHCCSQSEIDCQLSFWRTSIISILSPKSMTIGNHFKLLIICIQLAILIGVLCWNTVKVILAVPMHENRLISFWCLAGPTCVDYGAVRYHKETFFKQQRFVHFHCDNLALAWRYSIDWLWKIGFFLKFAYLKEKKFEFIVLKIIYLWFFYFFFSM